MPENKTTLIDIGVTNPLKMGKNGHIKAAAAKRLHSLEEYRKLKNEHFSKLKVAKDKYLFMPFIVETFGALGKPEVDFIRLISKRAAPRIGMGTSELANFLYQRISSICMLGAARSILARFQDNNKL